MEPNRSRLETLFRHAALACAAITVLFGGIVLLGWALDVSPLTRLSPVFPAVVPLVAVGFVLAGTALALLVQEPVTRARRAAATATAALALLIGLGAAFENASGFSLGIDGLFFARTLAGLPTANPGRPGLESSISFVLLGASLVALPWVPARRQRWIQYLVLAVGTLSFLRLVAYVYGTVHPDTNIDGTPGSSPLHTILAFVILSLGVLMARPSAGFLKLLCAPTEGGRVARLLLPAALALPVLLGFIRVEGQMLGIYSLPTGSALAAVLNVVALSGLVWWTARVLHRNDQQRSTLEAERGRLLKSEQHKSEQLGLAIREAHHRIKNNLQSITDLLSLELMSAEAAPAQGVLRDTIDRVQAIATVHDLLSQEEDLRFVNLRDVVERVVPVVLRSHGLTEQAVTTRVDVDELQVPSRAATTLALLLNELTSNCAKHAFRARGHGLLEIRLRRLGGEIELSVGDDGPGLPPDFLLSRDADVGLQIVQTLAESTLGGTMRLVSNDGLRVEVRFPEPVHDPDRARTAAFEAGSARAPGGPAYTQPLTRV
ncbi:MAG: sensor histidine kinase [Armatimonadota bacterium]